LEGLVDLALDAGKTKLACESTIVNLTVHPLKILRETAIKEAEILKIVQKKNILFICTGNSCRSVMAEGLLRKKLKDLGRQDVEVSSAGMLLVEGLGATDPTKRLLQERGVDASGHRSRRVTPAMLKRADLILVMESTHEKKVLEIAPEVKNRLFLLKEFAKISDNGFDIADPIGKPLEFYEKTYGIIKESVQRISNII
jgi:protein-tyrosine-phosphatase